MVAVGWQNSITPICFQLSASCKLWHKCHSKYPDAWKYKTFNFILLLLHRFTFKLCIFCNLNIQHNPMDDQIVRLDNEEAYWQLPYWQTVINVIVRIDRSIEGWLLRRYHPYCELKTAISLWAAALQGGTSQSPASISPHSSFLPH